MWPTVGSRGPLKNRTEQCRYQSDSLEVGEALAQPVTAPLYEVAQSLDVEHTDL